MFRIISCHLATAAAAFMLIVGGAQAAKSEQAPKRPWVAAAFAITFRGVPDDYYSVTTKGDRSDCEQQSRRRWLCPLTVIYRQYQGDPSSECLAPVNVTRKPHNWRFPPRLTTCPHEWLPEQ